MAMCELFGAASCPYTRELREWLDWKRRDYIEHDVEADGDALARMLVLTAGERSVPVLVEDGKVTQIGWQGRACIVGTPKA